MLPGQDVLPLLEPRGHHEAFHHVEDPLALTIDDLDEAEGLVLGEPIAAPGQQAGVAENGGERRLEIVGQGRDEIATPRVDLRQPCAGIPLSLVGPGVGDGDPGMSGEAHQGLDVVLDELAVSAGDAHVDDPDRLSPAGERSGDRRAHLPRLVDHAGEPVRRPLEEDGLTGLSHAPRYAVPHRHHRVIQEPLVDPARRRHTQVPLALVEEHERPLGCPQEVTGRLQDDLQDVLEREDRAHGLPRLRQGG